MGVGATAGSNVALLLPNVAAVFQSPLVTIATLPAASWVRPSSPVEFFNVDM
jgi:hypothetical protein